MNRVFDGPRGDERLPQTRRRVLASICATAVAPALWSPGSAAHAQTAAGRTMRWVVPYAAGGGPDVLTRRYLPRLEAALGQTVIVDNRVGAGGALAAEHVAQQRADGSVWLLGASTHLTQKALQPRLAFDPLEGFTHVSRLSSAPSILVVAAPSPHRDLATLVEALRAAPGRLNYGSGGVGSAAHLAAAAWCAELGAAAVHVPYRGSVDLHAALANGDIHFAIPTASTAMPLIQSKRLRALAVTSARRMALLPDVPSLKEATGSDDLILEAWSGVWLPPGASEATVQRVFAALRAVYADPEVLQGHQAAGVDVALSGSPAEFRAFVAAEFDKFQRLVRRTGLKVNE